MGLNIMVLNRDMGLGGGNTFLRNLAPALQQRGHRCVLVCAPGREVGDQLRAAFDQVMDRRLVFPWDASWLTGMIRKHRIDLVVATAVVQMPVAVRACAREQTPLVLNFQAPFPPDRVARFLPHAGSIMVMNSFQRDHFARMGAPADRIWICRWLMDWDVYAAKARAPEQRQYDAVFCARFSKTKGPLAVAFAEAVHELLPERPRMRALIIGFGRGIGPVEEAVAKVNAAAGRKAIELATGVFDTAPYFGEALAVIGGNYVCIEGTAAGAYAIGAGFDGVFGLVTPSNLEDAADQYFGDHMTPITGVKRDESTLASGLREGLRKAFANAQAGWGDSPSPFARPMFRREDAVEVMEREFLKAARGGA